MASIGNGGYVNRAMKIQRLIDKVNRLEAEIKQLQVLIDSIKRPDWPLAPIKYEWT